MDWTILGIEPIKDKKAITAAYRKRLLETNPEDKPEEFKALRAAYEEALRLADQPDEVPVRDESPVGLWMEKVRAVYNDFSARIQPDVWRKLLNDEVCIALDNRPLAEEALLNFLTEDYFLPQAVWQVLDDIFSLTARQEELYENYPRDFVEHAVLNGIRFPASLPYDLFIPGKSGKDCDAYRRLYFKANQTDLADLDSILDQMAALSEWHPYGQCLIHRLELERGQLETAAEGCRKLAETYPQDPMLAMAWASLSMKQERWEEAEETTRKILRLYPEHWQAKRLLAECLAKQGRYEDAKELIYELMRAAGGDQMQVHQLSEALQNWNEILIRQGEEQLRLHPEDSDNALKLAWSYLQNDKMDDALRAGQAADPTMEDQYSYYNLHGKLRYSRKEFDLALEHLQKLEAILRDMKPDGTEETAKRLLRLPEVMQLEGSCMMQLGQTAKARETYRQALELAPEEPEILTHTVQLLYSEGEYEESLPLLDRLIRLLPGAYHAYLLLALNLYELGRDRDAFEAVNRALELEGSDLNVYTLKMRILLRNGAWAEVLSILDFLEENEVGDELSVVWCRAQLTEGEERNLAKALEQYQAIAKRMEAGEPLPWASQVYYRIAVLMGNQRDAGKKADRDELLAILDKALAQNKNDMDCLDFKAWLLKRGGQTQEALELYLQLEAHPRHPLSVEHNLAELYYQDLARNAPKALHYYEFVLARNEHPDLHFFAGTCKRYLGDYAGAELHFLREQELAPEDVDGYNGLAYVYEGMGRIEDALAQLDHALARVLDRPHNYAWLYSHKVQILRRMNRPQDAINAINEAIVRYQYPAGYRLRFDICCQFGLWDQAQEMLEAWQKKLGESSDTLTAGIKLDLYRGQFSQACQALDEQAGLLNIGDREDLQLQIAELRGDFLTAVDIWRQRAQRVADPTHALMHLALSLWWAESRETARRTAEKALELLEEKLRQHLKNEILYRGLHSVALAILGREEEARAELNAINSMPLCEGCDYCRCKDADGFEAFLEEICGNHEKARELHRRGMDRWPDELDFAAGAARLNRKGT